MSRQRMFLWLPVAICITVLAYLGLGTVVHPNQSADNADGKFSLQVPDLMMSASADYNAPIAERLDAEAGMSAYFKSSDPINIAQVKSQFRTIETETTEYIIGSVAVPGYPEHFDAHVYVHQDGWVLAYYMNDESIGKIIDSVHDTITTTVLESVVSAVAGAAGAAFTQASYYDFSFPNATHMLLVAEDGANGNEFSITLPSNYGYFERGFATHGYYRGMVVDNTDVTYLYNSNYLTYGGITSAQLLPATDHLISVGDYGAIIILYRVP